MSLRAEGLGKSSIVGEMRIGLSATLVVRTYGCRELGGRLLPYFSTKYIKN